MTWKWDTSAANPKTIRLLEFQNHSQSLSTIPVQASPDKTDISFRGLRDAKVGDSRADNGSSAGRHARYGIFAQHHFLVKVAPPRHGVFRFGLVNNQDGTGAESVAQEHRPFCSLVRGHIGPYFRTCGN